MTNFSYYGAITSANLIIILVLWNLLANLKINLERTKHLVVFLAGRWLFLHLLYEHYFSAIQCKYLIFRIIMAEEFEGDGDLEDGGRKRRRIGRG